MSCIRTSNQAYILQCFNNKLDLVHIPKGKGTGEEGGRHLVVTKKTSVSPISIPKLHLGSKNGGVLTIVSIV